jgi:phage-related tail fiber protein
MELTNAAGHVNHQFVAEDPSINRPPTAFEPVDFNAWQNELVNIILAAGIVPSAADNAQVIAALQALFVSPAGVNGLISSAVAALVNSSPAALDTLNELALALGSDPNFATTVNTALAARMKWLGVGQALPVANVGPIWHDGFNSLMTWQVFDANGAAYEGYASQLVGSLLMDTQPTPRAGYVKSGVADLNRGTYAALRNWAIHNGIMVLSGAWVAGTIAMADNLDGTTFKVFDVRGEFPRFWDDGRGVDLARAFGSWQADELKSHAHVQTVLSAQGGGGDKPAGYLNAGPDLSGAYSTAATGGIETRPRNTAFLASIKF